MAVTSMITGSKKFLGSSILTIPVIYHEMRRRRGHLGPVFALLAAIPFFGPLVYLITRKIDG